MNKSSLRGAVLGHPITHSLSPILHKSAYKLLDIQGEYEAIDVKSGELQSFLERRGSEFDYLSLTMPLKEEALELKIDIQIDDLGRRIQSINTLIRHGESWRATSTDGSGFKKALINAGHDHFESVLILGAGGTARAVAGALDDFATSVDVMRRSVRRSAAIASCFRNLECNFLDWNDQIDLAGYDLVVNTTPSGAADLVAENLSRQVKGLLFDVLYKPWPTLLARRWSDAGGKVLGGLELLLYQGIDQLLLVSELTTPTFAQDLRIALTNAAN